MLIPKGPAYSWRKAFLLIFFSTLLSLSLFAFLQTRGDQPAVAIVQKAQTEHLPTQCLAELLELSVDAPVSFSHFPIKQAKKRLLEHPIFEAVSIKKIRPNILYIDYTLRTPIAQLGDQSNLAIDREGATFPLRPYFAIDSLPKVYSKGLGHEQLLKLLELPVKLVDLSKMDAPSLGTREIVVQLESGSWLRLPVHRLDDALAHFQKCELTGKIIDLRIRNTAYLTPQMGIEIDE